ncbi:MAG TPA: hypothetical protein VGW78_04370 [Candidatus Babeliales bacterium]|jgi:hypothetical protein|nr:hypothetical protein [Candidatus Babeliales bacterium]
MKQLSLFVIGMFLYTSALHAELLSGLAQCKDVAYRRDIYPFDQSLIIDLVKCADMVEEPKLYLRGVLKLFINIAKDTHYIDSESFNTILKQFCDILPRHFTAHKYQNYFQHQTLHHYDMLDRLKAINANLLFNTLSANYTQLRTEPAAFIEGLAEHLAAVTQEEMNIARLRFTLMTFLEIHLNKLIWSPEDQEETWELTKTIANQCAMLIENNILDDLNDLDDLYWTLIHRYGYFLDLTHTLLNDEVFTTIKRDVSRNNLHMFELEEQDSCIAKRSECLLEAVMFAEAKKKAFEKGLVSR